MRIYRSHPDDHFTIVPNDTFRDERLTPAAKGVLIELLTHSDGWVTNADAMWRRTQRSRGGDKKRGTGRRAYREAFTELEACGYLIRKTIRSEDGTFTTELHLYDTPQHRGTASGTPVSGTLVNGTSVSGTSSRSTSQRSTSERSTKEEHSSSLADTRAADAGASARDRGAELQELYEAVDRLNDGELHDLDLKFEQRRPRIYRKCRREMSKQFDEKDSRILKAVNASVNADNLSLKWALKHYYETADEWPAWLVRPLGWSPPVRRAA